MSLSPLSSHKFEIIRKIGTGGMGTVFLAYARELGNHVALKFLRPGLDPTQQSFFQQEVKLLSGLSHPNLIQIFDFFDSEQKQLLVVPEFLPVTEGPFFSMEYVEGKNLQDSAKTWDTNALLRIFVQLCQGLNYLHNRDLLHRDLKPSNILVAASEIPKVLDFGLATPRRDASSQGPLGTLAYLPPEAFWGDYNISSDIFSLGVVFYEILSGRLPYLKPLSCPAAQIEKPVPLSKARPDLPEYFVDLIHRMLELSPARRPHSALALIRYLNQHVETPFPIVAKEAFTSTLQKTPLVGREEVLQRFFQAHETSGPSKAPLGIELVGPTGIGRSRLLEEMKWPLQLQGVAYLPLSPQESETWLQSLQGFLEIAETPTDLVQFSRDVIAVAQRKKIALACCDLHQWAEPILRQLQIFLSLIGSHAGGFTVILEYNSDFPSAAVDECMAILRSWPRHQFLALQDLSPEQSREFIAQATLETPVGSELEEEIIKNSGGRPLLLLEAIRNAGKIRDIPKNLEEAAVFRVRNLSLAAQELLSLLCAHSHPANPSDILALFQKSETEFEATVFELARQNFLQARSAEYPWLALAHPSLQTAYRQALSELLPEAHRRWLEFFKRKAPSKIEPGIQAAAMAEHALALRQANPAIPWGSAAAEYFEAKGDYEKAIHWYQQLLSLADSASERVLIYNHLAHLYNLTSQYQASLKAYDEWLRYRVDDASFLQKVKHRFYAGLVLLSCGDESSSRERLEDCLRIGDSLQYPAHRPYHARAHSLLASLEEKRGDFTKARAHLETARGLAENNPALLGEIEKKLGHMAQSESDYESALTHFRRSLDYHRQAGDRQAEAIALHSIGMAYREQGHLREAMPFIRQSIEQARTNGQVVQWARYIENLGLLYFDLGEYRQAVENIEVAQDILQPLGNNEDRTLLNFLRGACQLYAGNFAKALALLEESTQLRSSLEVQNLYGAYLDLMGEAAYLIGDYPKADKFFQECRRAEAKRAKGSMSLLAGLGVCRARLRQLALSPQDSQLREILPRLANISGPFFKLWKNTLQFLTTKASETDLFNLLSEIRSCERTETRIDIYTLLFFQFRILGLKLLAVKIKDALAYELKKIYESLPEELKMDFEKNRNLQSLEKKLESLLPGQKDEPSSAASEQKRPAAPPTKHQISEARFLQFSQINHQIAKKKDLGEILERVLDAAIELTGAQRGFLLLKNESVQTGPISGYEIKTARNLNQQSLGQKDFQLSMSVVKQVVQQGTFILTDNAQLDSRFQGKESVVLYQLKSILVVPLEIEGQVLGSIYLDHPYQPDCFSEEDVVLLNSFAGQVALAIEKAQMMEELRQAKRQLETQVESQSKHIEVLTHELAQVRDELKYEYKEIVGQSPPMMKVFQLLDHVTETTIPVWIYGESGTGKELIASSLHYNSPRKSGAFVTENVSAIPETLLESELFGHKRGAFTHADRDRIGLFEQASGGTLFLDEVSDMSLAMQAKLLRVLQEGEVRPLGSNKKVKVDVRLVTASNRDLNQMVKDEKFRQDLFFRINGLTIKLPPLRERKEDIPLLVEHMIKKIVREFNLKSSEVTDGAYQVLLRHSWPGNIRELEGMVRNALLFAKGRPITPEFLSLHPGILDTQSSGLGNTMASPSAQAEEQSAERQVILDALRRHQMEKNAVAEELGVSLRTLYTRMERLGIPKKKTVLAKYLGLK